MVTKISHGIQISVDCFFQQDYSNVLLGEFTFAYRITIENHNSFAVKLLYRNWNIFDSNGVYKEVEGDGVVGVQPTILSNEKYTYVSGCNLKTEMGKMHGTYTMQNLQNKNKFLVNIPVFEMIYPFKNN
jgi:ApaG protein